MKLKVTLNACCLNCRHYDKDERTAYRYMRQRRQDKPPVFCPEEGVKNGICDKFLPRKKDVQHEIWKAKEFANREFSGAQRSGASDATHG